MADVITTLHPEGVPEDDLYPNIKKENLPSNLQPVADFALSEYEKTLNLWDEAWENVIWRESAGGVKAQNSNAIGCSSHIKVSAETTYYFGSPTGSFHLCFYDANKTFIRHQAFGHNFTFTTPANCAYFTWYSYNSYGTTYNHDIIIAKGNQPVAYHPYNGDVMHEIDCQGVRLWENGAPNFPSGFDPQTVSVADMSSYRILKFVYKLSASPDTSYVEMRVQFLTSSVFNMPAFGDDGTLHLRKVTFASSKSVTFGSGYVGSTLNNGAIIPVAIYGIK